MEGDVFLISETYNELRRVVFIKQQLNKGIQGINGRAHLGEIFPAYGSLSGSAGVLVEISGSSITAVYQPAGKPEKARIAEFGKNLGRILSEEELVDLLQENQVLRDSYGKYFHRKNMLK